MSTDKATRAVLGHSPITKKSHRLQIQKKHDFSHGYKHSVHVPIVPQQSPVMPEVHVPSRASAPGRMIVVYGYGCDVFQKNLQMHRHNLQTQKHPSFGAVDVFCNDKEPRSMTYDIWKTLVKHGILLDPTPFVRKIIDHVCESLRRRERVTLVGHSYGGSVVSRVAMYLKANCSNVDTSLLRIITYGSIFIPPLEATHGIAIDHIVYSNDIAKLCHKKSSRCPKQNNIHVLRHSSWNPIAVHMNYDGMILDVAKKGVV